MSDSGSGNGASYPPNFSDEDVMLASCYPKKRAGRKKLRETRHPVFRGVCRRNSRKWVCEVRECNDPKFTGTGKVNRYSESRFSIQAIPTPTQNTMAARAHDVAALALRGRLACLNFVDSAWRLLKAAAEASKAFRPVDSVGDSSKIAENTAVEGTKESEEVFYLGE
ncbi:hypothetical protein CXB51_030855 [Gossypium anomalum]|uniref:AP2/ERF domain-containing protein n=1 Tax=Gossypium anomalum TaxID=47600 RepID=A0A8J5Y9S0_9ROSI|nr:hypothetical protein CXB51_030855 [Gossypium anomalum]